MRKGKYQSSNFKNYIKMQRVTQQKSLIQSKATNLSMEVCQREIMRSWLCIAQSEGRLLVQRPSVGLSQGAPAVEGQLLQGLAHAKGGHIER